MDQGNTPGRMPSEKSAPPALVGRVEAVATSAYETSAVLTIDFHSAEFNRMDDLTDCAGNYRTFQPLDGIVTADMRHQMERLCIRDDINAAKDDKDPPQKGPRDTTEPEPPPHSASPLTVISRGRVLIVDTDAERATACGKLLGDRGLTCTLLLTRNRSAVSLPGFDSLKLFKVDALSVDGAFGGFSAQVNVKGDWQPLSEWLGEESSAFDLVLDLQSIPSYAGDGLPMGYYAPGTDPVTLQVVMAELPEMRGRFHRPQFMAFLKNRCFHGRSRTRDCRQCLVVCPFGAIQSVNRTISIDHYRCQGCGGCAMVCPAEAIQMVHPSSEERLSMIRHTMGNRLVGDACQPTLVISEMETADAQPHQATDEKNHDRRIRLEVEQIGHVGLEMLLVALAHGAGAVVVNCGAQNPPEIIKSAEWQAQMGRAILRGLGMPEDKIRFAVIGPRDDRSEKVTGSATRKSRLTDGDHGGNEKQTASLPDRPAPWMENFTSSEAIPEGRSDWPLLPPVSFTPNPGKQTLVRLATQYLYDRSGMRESWIPLPAGSPFGAIAIDPAACTLCMACAAACPSGALSARGDVPRLEFLESRCHQCRLCEEACPEGAIRPLPRILCDPDAVEAPAVLHEAEPVRCIECGAPFASRAMLDRIQGKLTGHWMYAAERQLRRLQMCGTCRTRDALVSQDMKAWNPQ